MGREIRRVPPNWRHPEKGLDRVGMTAFRPLHNERFEDKFAEWLRDFDRIRAGDLTDIERECYPRGLPDWLLDEGKPYNPAYYRDYSDEDATWFQVYETVTEGTPVTPPFASKQELIEHLVTNGTWLDESAWAREAAERFVETEWAPTMIVTIGGK